MAKLINLNIIMGNAMKDLFKEQIILKNAMSDFSPFPELQSDFIPKNNW